MEFHPSFDLVRRNVVTTRFQTLRQLFGTAEQAHRLAADIHLEKKRVALTDPFPSAGDEALVCGANAVIAAAMPY